MWRKRIGIVAALWFVHFAATMAIVSYADQNWPPPEALPEAFDRLHSLALWPLAFSTFEATLFDVLGPESLAVVVAVNSLLWALLIYCLIVLFEQERQHPANLTKISILIALWVAHLVGTIGVIVLSEFWFGDSPLPLLGPITSILTWPLGYLPGAEEVLGDVLYPLNSLLWAYVIIRLITLVRNRRGDETGQLAH